MVSAYIRCDICGFTEDTVYLHTNRIRQCAQSRGWRRTNTSDLCPKCVKQQIVMTSEIANAALAGGKGAK